MPQLYAFLLFLALNGFSSCQPSEEKSKEKSNTEITEEIEKKNLELKQKELKLKEEELINKENALLREKEGISAVQIAKRQKQFENAAECVVVKERAYFYSSADPNTIRKSYLVRGDRCQPVKTQNSFIYINFYNAASERTTSGWISMDDLEVVVNDFESVN